MSKIFHNKKLNTEVLLIKNIKKCLSVILLGLTFERKLLNITNPKRV